MKYFTGLNCEHKKEIAEYVNKVRYLRCIKCLTVREG